MLSVIPLCYCLVVSTSEKDCLERLVTEMTYYVSNGTLCVSLKLLEIIPADLLDTLLYNCYCFA